MSEKPRPAAAGDDAARLELAALRYFLGELDAAGQARFERRLDRDQTARDALEQAVWICQAADSLPAAPAHGAPARPIRRGSWRLTAAAVLMVGVALGLMRLTPRAATHDNSAAQAEQLVALWIELGADDDTDGRPEDARDATGDPDDADTDDADADGAIGLDTADPESPMPAATADEDDDLPDWLLLALGGGR